ncbi:hypothetical protein NX722_03840 [Endozoicomonas gorgoniicola]|uniref:Bacteriophage-related protein n=1 Tax=Endozoicomonas gorgoniicola TaxID=1234144 RepID=A0ABT3MQX9_9GAMM|nr:hypothetical protein [Endozoicomonas gorgoniicola]MCW7551783.1 hypothetical protein [Endozoicomonas gorgoniicola]
MARIRKTAEETVEFLEDENLIKVTVPIRIFHRGGKATIETPDGMIGHEDMVSLQRALIQGHRWMKMLESGRFKSVRNLAEKEKIDKARISKLIRLTCLAPEIQEAILCNTGTWVLLLKDCLKPFPMLWDEQREHFKSLSMQLSQ